MVFSLAKCVKQVKQFYCVTIKKLRNLAKILSCQLYTLKDPARVLKGLTSTLGGGRPAMSPLVSSLNTKKRINNTVKALNSYTVE